MDKITVLILAAGKSSRMWPLVNKNFIQYLGMPLAYYTLTQLAQFGLAEIVIVANESNIGAYQKLKDQFNNLNLSIIKQAKIKGQAGAVLSAEKFIEGKKTLIINQSDLVENILFQQFFDYQKAKPFGILVSKIVDQYFPGGYLTVKDGWVSGVVEKPPSSKKPSNLVRLVFDYYRNGSDIVEAIRQVKSGHDDRYEKAIASLIDRGKKIKSLKYNGFWGHLKYPWHVLDVSSYFLGKIRARIHKDTEINNNVKIIGEVIIEDNVRILENTSIIGPAFIGSGTVIGQNCLIRQSMIGKNNVIGYSSEITRCHIGNNCWFHSNYVGDSVISDYCAFGAGVVAANFRLDETVVKSKVKNDVVETGSIKLGTIVGKNVRIGVNVSIMPGVKIGKNSFVGSGVTLMNDLQDNKICLLKDASCQVKPNKYHVKDASRASLKGKLSF